ncbi:AIR synthase-related protein, C-terminal domain-containing protein, partial [Cynara cardunculus var. scolymus]
IFDQIGNECPDVDDVLYLKAVFEVVQDLLTDKLISIGHDISDGGLIVSVLEMAFAELDLVLEISKANLDKLATAFVSHGVSADIIGQVTVEPRIGLEIDGITHLDEKTANLWDIWEETSFHLEKIQRLVASVISEKEGLKNRHEPAWGLSFTPRFTNEKHMSAITKLKVAVIREEGNNGDREMSVAFFASGFEPWDIIMSDLLNGSISLNEFRGIAFMGGFSYADLLYSTKGWAASVRFNQPLLKQFQKFYNRPNTFSIGICDGCQLMALLGWIPGPQVGGVLGNGDDPSQPRFVHNESCRFICRFTSVTIKQSPTIMFKGVEGSTLGVWAAHGEGKAYFPDNGILDQILSSDLTPVRYCDDDGKPT